MSRVSPDWRSLHPTTLGQYAELHVLRLLDEGLPPGFTILHGVDWSAGDGADERHGEVDVVVIGPAADVVLIEVKSGHIDTSSDTFVKRYGQDRRDVLAQERIGDLRLRRFTGRYEEGGGAIWTDGDLMAETVRRFKGQSAPAVVLTECELSELDAVSRRLLFVGLTRASLSLEWVISRRTEACLARVLEGEG